MIGGDGQAKAAGSLRDGGRADGRNEKPFLKQGLAHPYGLFRIMKENRDNWAFGGGELKPHLFQPLIEVIAVGP